ncbi:hypothetical protein COCNU_scaffold033387G000010 [Cocos nucifera]|nr:hypothetical protein [Cocos nucifera]
MSQCKVCHDGPNNSDEELEENPFHNREIIRGLIDGFTIPEVVDQIIDVDVNQRTWDLLGSFLKMGHQLLSYIRSLDHSKSELVRTWEGCQVKVERLPKKKDESQIEANPLPKGVPLKTSLRRLRKEVYHLKRKIEKMEGELKKSKKNYVEASIEIDLLCQAHKKAFMDYIRKKRNLEVELKEVKERTSEKAWSLTAKASSLDVELNAVKEKKFYC